MNNNFENIPRELKEKKQWVLWKKRTNPDKPDKPTKIPCQITGKPAKSNDSTTWSSFESVASVYEKGGYSGIGFMFNNDYIGIDIDDCVKDGVVSGIAQYYIDAFQSYSEYSQSKKGIHIIVKNTGIPGSAKQKKPFEIYNSNRYFAITGDLVKPELNTIKENDLAVKEFYINQIKNEPEKPQIKKQYEKISGGNQDDFVKCVLDVLSINPVCGDFDSWKRLALAFKSANLEYHEVDHIFANSPGYDQKQNEYLYKRMKPSQISFGTAYHLAKQSNPELLKEKLLEIRASNISIAPNIPPDKATKNSIFERDNKTYIVKMKKGNGLDGDSYFDLELASFTMSITKRISDDNGDVSYQVKLQSSSENETFEIAGGILGNINQFRETIMRKGAFLYNITDTPTHNQYISFVLEKNIITKARKTQYLGMIEQGYLTHNCLVKKDGSIIPIEEANIIPPKPENAAKKMIISSEKIDIKEFLYHLQNIVGSQIWKVFGFIVATLFRDKIFESLVGFPILFFYGSTQTGKNVMAKIIQSCLACHRSIGSIPSGTFKAWKRLGAKFRNGALILNEFQSNEKNNLTICNLFDGEGYARSKKDNGLDTESLEVNASAIIISTLALTGSKSEDAQSRIIEVDSNKFKKNQISSFNWLKANMDNLSSILPEILKTINGNDLVEEINSNVDKAREIATKTNTIFEERILKNHVAIVTAYNKMMETIGADTVTLDEAIEQIEKQTETTKQSNLALTFLNHLTTIVRNDDIKKEIATITKEEGTTNDVLVFRLQDCLPIVKRLGKQSGIDIADKKTIEISLKLLNCEYKTTRKLGNNETPKAWHYVISDSTSDFTSESTQTT